MNIRKAYIYCWLVAIIWGMSYIALDKAFTSFSCFQILFIRFMGSTILALFFIFPKIKEMKMKTVKKGILNGFLLFLSYAMQTYAQTMTSVGNNAFISASSVVMVPYLCWLLFKQKLQLKQIFSSLICFIGIIILTGPIKNFEKGDIFALCCAIFYALYLVSLQYTCKSEDSSIINAIQLGTCSFLSFVGLFLFPRPITTMTISSILSCLYMIFLATFLCLYLQTKAQQIINASQCSVIISMESLFAVIFSIILLKDPMHFRLLIGGTLILGSVIFIQSQST